MRTPKPYHWEFERSAFDSASAAQTFSVGIFQWLPKADGKGLKKTKTLRVSGYTANSEAVYTKAAEVCDRLNRAEARFDSLPDWAQKHYSVTRPKDLVLHRATKDLTGREARNVRLAVMRKLLLPAGFIQSHASTYVRLVDEVVQVINFQTMTWGGKFTVNLGLHYTFTPVQPTRKQVAWTALDVLNCSLERRIGFFLPEKLDTWFPFGTNPDTLRESYAMCATKSVAILERYSARLKDPARLLPSARKTLRPFDVTFPSIFYASIEIRLGRYDAATKRLNEPLLPEHRAYYLPRHRQLLHLITELRKLPEGSERSHQLLRWVK